MNTPQTAATQSGTRKRLGLSFGDVVTMQTWNFRIVTGTVSERGSGWELVDSDAQPIPGTYHNPSQGATLVDLQVQP